MTKYKYEGIYSNDIHTKLFELSDVVLNGVERSVFDYNGSTGEFCLVASADSEVQGNVELYMIANFGENYSIKEEV